MHYTFDNVGNILSVQDNGRGETTNYTYDDLNRLLSASVTTGTNQYARAWTYDALGNMQTRNDGSGALAYTYDPAHKHAVKQAGANYFCYDANGNMTRRNATSAACSNGDTLAYDVENRLTQVIKGSTTNFAYNGDGIRVKREAVGIGTTYYIGNYFEVYVPNGGSATFNKYYYFGSQRVAGKIAGTLFFFQGDHLGSSSVALTQSGASFYSRQTYYPYGAVRTTEGSPLPIDYTFTGQKSDASTGLMFYGARYYDASLGRFIQADTIVPSPLNPQSLNRFAYVLNNPVRYTDSTGHMACADECDPGGGGGDPNFDPCYPMGCVIEPLADGKLGEKNKIDGTIVIVPLPVASGSSQVPATPSAPFGCDIFPQLCRPPSTIYSVSGIAGALWWFKVGGEDIVFDWETNQIALFNWVSGTGKGWVLPPQAGLSGTKGYVYGLGKVEDYAGPFDVLSGGVAFVTGSGFLSADKKAFGYEGGFTLSTPKVGIAQYRAGYAITQIPILNIPAVFTIDPVVMRSLWFALK